MSLKNRLSREKSPYLLQHAENPVDWYAWSPEAFQKARQEDKPIFLSIGYSTCHWCHVMAHESFENEAIAAFLNAHFISIKVDREERPDIDGIYMSAVQAMTSHGGWPLSVFLNADQKPFFGGTYFPPTAKWGSPGFLDVLRSIEHAWKNNREQLIRSADQLTSMLQESAIASSAKVGLSARVIEDGVDRFRHNYDPTFAGFGNEPKFPSSHNLDFLMRAWYANDDPHCLDMVLHTLRRMAEGGIYDHLGGGFHRYSTDRMWQIPHFEKMIYDQAGLARSYLEAYQITKDNYFAQVARDIFSYVIRDLKDAAGGFYSAEDADSIDPAETKDESSIVKKEGAFYVWRFDEIKEILTPEQWEVFYQRFGIKEGGNAHSDPHQEFTGKNILFALQTPQAIAQKLGMPLQEVDKLLAQARQALQSAREKRPRPHLDDKVIVDWNGLMISSLAYGARVLHDDAYLKAAEAAADFIISRLIDQSGRLYHRYRDGDIAVKGSLEDYAFFIDGLLELYQSNFKASYLERAFRLSESMIDLFWDHEAGGFFFSAHDAEKLLVRQKEIYDGAMPSGNSMAASVLIRLYHISLDEKWRSLYDKCTEHFSQQLSHMPNAFTKFLTTYQFKMGPSIEIVIAADDNDERWRQYAREISGEFLPFSVVLFRPTQDPSTINKIAPFVQKQVPVEGKASVYICQNHSCKLPVNNDKDLRAILDQLIKRSL